MQVGYEQYMEPLFALDLMQEDLCQQHHLSKGRTMYSCPVLAGQVV